MLYRSIATYDLGKAMQDGTNYCEVDGVLKKFSFVLLVTSEHDNNFYLKDKLENKTIIKDSRGRKCVEGLFSHENHNYGFEASTPEYLIVFNLN